MARKGARGREGPRAAGIKMGPKKFFEGGVLGLKNQNDPIKSRVLTIRPGFTPYGGGLDPLAKPSNFWV